MKRYNGSSWVSAKAKRYNGSSWVDATVKRIGSTTSDAWDGISKQTKSATLPSIWHALYDNNNKVRTDRGTDLQQGKRDGDTTYSIAKSLIGFSNILAYKGKDITSIRVYLKSVHWYYATGGTVHIGWHTHASKPTTWSHSKYSGAQKMYTAKVQEQWIDMPKAFIDGVKEGTIKGISIYYNSAEWHGYGLFAGYGSATPPKMQIYYSE